MYTMGPVSRKILIKWELNSLSLTGFYSLVIIFVKKEKVLFQESHLLLIYLLMLRAPEVVIPWHHITEKGHDRRCEATTIYN